MKKEGVDGRKQNMRSTPCLSFIETVCSVCRLIQDKACYLVVNGKILVGKCAVWRCPSQAPTDIEAGKCSVSLGGVVWCMCGAVYFFEQCTVSFHPAVGKRLWWFPCRVRSGKPSRRQKVPFSKTTVWSSLPKGTATRTWQAALGRSQ